MTRFKLDVPNLDDVERMSGWISDSEDLPLISELTSKDLSSDTLQGWLDTSASSAVIRVDGETIAMATLSVEEAPLRPDTAEICHLIVHREWRRRYNGSHLLLELALRARELGFSAVVGRVVPSNTVAQKFLSSLRWTPVDLNGACMPRFSWYMKGS